MNRTLSTKTRSALHAAVMALGLFGLAVSGCFTAHADTLDQTVNRLLDDHQPAAAMAAVDSALQNEPARAEYRFLKAVVLSEMGRHTEALELFGQLSRDLPASPEPLNNLGVLHARQGQLEEARVALTAAVEKDPAYATAYENLGDVHARLAAQAYDKAVQLTPGHATAPPKLALVSQIAALPGRDGSPKTQRPPVPAGTAAPAGGAGAAPLAAATPTEPAVARGAETADVEAVVRAWAQDWSRRDTAAYLARYTPGYAPAGMRREAWEKLRRARIEGKAAITVRLNDLQVKVQGREATARFLQEYTTDNLHLRDRKTLHLVQEADQVWRIDRETTD